MEKTKDIRYRSNVAILFSHEQNWAFEIQPHHPDLDYVVQVKKYYAYFHNRNIAVDFVSAESDFSTYRLLVGPLQYLTNKKLVEKFKTFVMAGGNLVLTMRTGVKDEDNVCVTDQLPGRFADLLGIEIADYDCLRGASVQVSLNGEIAGEAQKWCDVIGLKGAEALGHYEGEFYKRFPAVTVNAVGKGRAYYVGFEPDSELMRATMDRITTGLNVAPIAAGKDQVEVVRRPSMMGNYYFVLNHSGKKVSFTPGAGWKTVLGSDVLEPYGVTVYCD
jgi:beta-galactosidase